MDVTNYIREMMKTISKRELIKLLKDDQYKNWEKAFLYAYQVKHIDQKDPNTNYMYMGYDNESQVIFFKEQLTRQIRELPTLEIDPSIQSLEDIEPLLALETEDIMSRFTLHSYNPHPPITFKVAV